MASSAQGFLEQVLEEGGFVQKGKWSSGLINAEIARSSPITDLRYRHLFERSEGNSPIIDLVYEVPSQIEDTPGTPCIYFKVVENPSYDAIRILRSQIWNQGRAPTLWIVTPNSVLIYNSYARPKGEEEDEKSYLLAELKHIGGQIENLSDFHKRTFDTGDFWQSSYGKKISKQQRVDTAMLADLRATESALIKNLAASSYGLSESIYISIVHALLGRAIFVSYLVDKGLLDPSFFQREYNRESFVDLLEHKEATYSFFKWLKETFNGDLFPIQSDEENIVNEDCLAIIRFFLSGLDMSLYPNALQPRFWPYKFDFIPVELISSIYEMFAHSRDSSTAEASSVHYTRLPLVELVLSLAMRDISHTARVLDPACGSGIFLVEAFRNLVWKREKEYGKPVKRDELHEMLGSQIFGIDIDRDAVHVTAFSLYLTLLDLDPAPQPITASKFPKFPFLLKPDSTSDHVPNLYVQDFFNTDHAFNRSKPFASKRFDLIVGNPPWTALKERTAPRDPDNPKSGRQWGLQYCREHNIPDNKPDQAFMIRVRDFAQKHTLVAFIVCSRIFYQKQNPTWLREFLETVTLNTVINLSDLVGEDILFGGNSLSSTRLPASIVIYQTQAQKYDSKVTYITPKWHLSLSGRDEIIITDEDRHNIPQKLLQEQPFLWKSAFHGSARDYRLLSKLRMLPSLAQVLSRAGVSESAHRGISFGKGMKKPTPEALMGKPFLKSGSQERYRINVDSLSPFDEPEIAQKSNTKFLRLPALILSRSLNSEGSPNICLVENSAERHELVIDQMYYGIPSSDSYPYLVYQLNAILNSELAFYMAFMFSSALGWDRRLLEEGDWLQVRLPSSIFYSDTNTLWQEILNSEEWLRKNWMRSIGRQTELGRNISQEQVRLNQAIYDLYGLSDQEICLVQDTIKYSIKPILRKDLRVASARAQANNADIQNYARRICTQLNGILGYSGQKITSSVISFSGQSPLRACRFIQRDIGSTDVGSNEMVSIVHLDNIDDIINQIAQNLRAEVADQVYVQRSLRVYEEDGFWIIKNSQQRLWSESAALNDADVIIWEHMDDIEE